MTNPFTDAVQSVIEQATNQPATIKRSSGVSGGCINDAKIVELTDGRRYFVKSNAASRPRMFQTEAMGLNAMAASNTIRVPRVIGTGGKEQGTTPFIVLEAIESGGRKSDFQALMGQRFAQMHQATTQDQFGFDEDNYIGSTPQPNGWMDDWISFWRERRIGFQLRLARRQGLTDDRMDQLGDRFLGKLDDLISEPHEPACLLHGDLWSGNYIADESGEPVLIDPATYYGRREADLAMTMLFGGFDRKFYAAYEEVWPLADGSDERLEVYKLYHLLNHLNLFGSSYYGGCLAILNRYAS